VVFASFFAKNGPKYAVFTQKTRQKRVFLIKKRPVVVHLGQLKDR